MILKQALSHAKVVLMANNIEDASLESEILLRHTLKISKTGLYLETDRKLSPEQEENFWQLVKRRLNGEPTAYITGHREFYGLDFYVDSRVLIPRPESETLVEKALNHARNYPISSIADIGTGCGAIAISLALHLPQTKIYATDLSTAALDVALINCRRHGVTDSVSLLEGDMLGPLPESIDLIIANLPYVKESELSLINSLYFEPSLSLNGGPNGLEKIYRLCCQAGDKLCHGGCLLLEIGAGQREAVTTCLRSLFPSARIEVAQDLGNIDRVVSLHLTLQHTQC